MADIKPRWEWRSFGSRFNIAEAALARLEPSGVQESDEVYLVSARAENVKVRDALMDVKVLRATDSDGLEQWIPIMKAGFPLSAAALDEVLAALHLPMPDVPVASCTFDEFVARFLGPESGVRVVKVHKRRVRYAVEGCMAELSDIVVDGNPPGPLLSSPRTRRPLCRPSPVLGWMVS